MGIIKIKTLALISMLSLSALSYAQSSLNHTETSTKELKMENQILIGKVYVPKNSIEEFHKQNVTSSFLKALPGFIEGKLYERFDDSGNLYWISITTWLDQEMYENAQKSLKEYYKSIKFKPMVFREKLGIIADHELYTLSAY